MRTRRGPLLLAIILAVGTLLGLAAVGGAEGWESEVSKIQVVSALIGGKNVFIPSTIVVTSGREHTLSLFNTTDVPHGFAIDALGIEAVLQPGVEQEVVLPASGGGRIYGIRCQLHPAHRTATLVVVPAKSD